ncbi:phage tail protein I [uncultured Novosphingobium sp.]|mgnify:CR=1 FL=1|uniref:phage tail protein I n=1 Tax=uncultured Novosphingobium sp. TaxID=292277 RepID=UPI002591C9E7|nr:phage tail protein I [uncultured Novosphingobium sp.]
MSILPPNATTAERALEDAMLARIDLSSVPTLRDPWTCPAEVLPVLASELSISHWDTAWSEAEKRQAVADATAFHKIKGTRAAVEEVLARHHGALDVVVWHEANPRRSPFTFEVRAPAAEIPASFLTQDRAEAIIRDVAAAKSLRDHFDFVQNIGLTSGMFVAAGGKSGTALRADYAAARDDSRDWSILLQTEDGEPIANGEAADFLETH